MQKEIAESVEVSEEKRIELAKHLVKLKKRRGLGFNQLALKSNLNVRSLTDILNGKIRKINPFQLKNLAIALKISYLELYRIIGYVDEEDITSNNKLILTELREEIPVYSKIHIDSDKNLKYGEILEYLTIPKLGNGSEIIGLKVDGNSMEHIIPSGATVLVKKDAGVHHNEIGVFIYKNNLLVKRLKDKNNILLLTSENNNYDPILVTDKDYFYVVGKVVEVMYEI